MVNHFIPKTLLEALTYRHDHPCYIMAGGTDLMVQKFVSANLLPNFDKDVLYLGELQELNYINKDKDGALHIGAAAKFSDILLHKDTPKVLKEIISELAGPNIRNMATMAGNVANASPAGDSIVGLYLLDAKLELVSINGSRFVPASEFVVGVRKTILNDDELIKEIIIPNIDKNLVTYWKKVGSRQAESITKVSFAGAYKIENNIIKDLRIVFGSVSTTVVRKKDFEEKLLNKNVKDLNVKEICDLYKTVVQPITDQRSTKDYRLKVGMNILEKFLLDMKGVAHEE